MGRESGGEGKTMERLRRVSVDEPKGQWKIEGKLRDEDKQAVPGRWGYERERETRE